MSATGEADHEWEMEDLSPREAAVVSCRGAAFEAARSRRGWSWARPCFVGAPSSLGLGVHGPRDSVSPALARLDKIETFESPFRWGWRGRGMHSDSRILQESFAAARLCGAIG